MRHNFRELIIWKKSMELTKGVYEVTADLPDDERYGLRSQLRRSSVSIPSNIAEGSGRTSDKEFYHFLNISLSSSYELETQLILADQLFNIKVNKHIEDLQQLQKMIGGFKRSIKAS